MKIRIEYLSERVDTFSVQVEEQTKDISQYLSGFGGKGKGKRERKNLYPLPFNLFPKPNSSLKSLTEQYWHIS